MRRRHLGDASLGGGVHRLARGLLSGYGLLLPRGGFLRVVSLSRLSGLSLLLVGRRLGLSRLTRGLRRPLPFGGRCGDLSLLLLTCASRLRISRLSGSLGRALPFGRCLSGLRLRLLTCAGGLGFARLGRLSLLRSGRRLGVAGLVGG